MNDSAQSQTKDECIIAVKHGDSSARTQRIIVDFREVPLIKLASLSTTWDRNTIATASWNTVFERLKYSLRMNVIGQTNCSAVLLGEHHLTLELVVTTKYLEEATTAIANYIDPYGINCGIVEL